MKKFLIGTAAIVLLLLAFLIVFLNIRQNSSYKNRIHQNADLVIKIGVDDMIKTMAFDFISNPMYYLRSPKKSGTKDSLKKEMGISFPANVFIYTIKNKSANTFFLSLPVSDSAKLNKYITEKLGIDSFITDNGVVTGVSKDHKTTIAYNNNNVAIAYSVNAEPVTDILTDMTKGKNMLATSDLLIHNLKQKKSHIEIIDAKNEVAIDFKKGRIVFHSNLQLDSSIHIANEIKCRRGIQNAPVNLWLNAQFSKMPPVLSVIKAKEFSLDSLFAPYNGYVDMQIGGREITQTDSVVTYDYNDNFETVQQVSVQQTKVPDISISLKVKPSTDFNNLLSKTDDGEKILKKEIFPLYTLYVKQENDYLHLGTNKNEPNNFSEETTNYFFSLAVDFTKLAGNELFEPAKKFTQNLTTLELKGKKNSEQTASVEGYINFRKSNINALSQLEL